MELLSQMWSLLGLLTVLQNVLPSQLLSLLHSLWQSLQDSLTPYSYFDVPEFLGSSAVEPNDLYRQVHLYLHQSLLHSPTPSSAPLPRLTLSLPRGAGGDPSAAAANPVLSLSPNHSLEDSFAGHRLVWTHHSDTLQDSLEERRSFALRLPKRAPASALLRTYLAHLSAAADALERSSRPRRLHTNSPRGGPPSWSSVPFRHPATFATLALDPALKSRLLADLSAFAAGRDFYRRTGRPWKRGYLLHGPPGSGKSSLIAAMANHLRYDVYDLELTRVSHNSDLRSLLIQTNNRSLIVIEDIDCSLELTGDRRRSTKSTTATSDARSRKKRQRLQSYEDSDSINDGCGDDSDGRVTLSGLLNFTDGLWSCCGEERIIVFTTNYADGVDPALLRAGRMDVHLRLGACGAHAVRELVERFVGVAEHELLGVAESCVRAGAEMTPAEVGEVLLRNREDPEKAVRELVAELQARVRHGGGGGNGGGEEEEGWEEREEGSPTESWEGSPEKVGRKGRAGWERRVRFLGRLKSLTKSDSGRRGV
ncbi:AAA-ATPase At4g25835-like [Phoenix dactylifera]|uniref:AAA-ATPase At4g25835-like n=1 Tax=Phoenix dactylifera TaxID=42345 RepID=A0A8B9AHR9_PHODC|nr:AAA-ATPase At4g25835-like [Phoenix dactylifera]